MRCKKCQGPLEQVGPQHMTVWFCRMCRVAHDHTGTPLVENPHILKTHFDALKITRSLPPTSTDESPGVRLAMEARHIQGLQEAYMAGLRDGILLSLNLDYEKQ